MTAAVLLYFHWGSANLVPAVAMKGGRMNSVRVATVNEVRAARVKSRFKVVTSRSLFKPNPQGILLTMATARAVP